MDIGIVTVYNAVNYGSYLQAFALQEILKSLVPTANVKMIKTSSFIYEKWRFTSLFSYNPKKIPFKYRLLRNYLKSWKKFSIDKKPKKYDLLIIGSDEMWQLKNMTLTPLPQFFGVGLDAKRKITYGVSCNNTTPKDVEQFTFIKDNINKLDAISVRDEATYATYSNYINKNISMVIDPTFLVDMNKYAILPNEKDYLLIYTYKFRQEMIKLVKEYAKLHNLKIYCVGQNFEWCDKRIPASPFEFLGYIKNARIVFTDTFHGTVLSIALKKPFYVFASHKVKVKKIIEQLDLDERNISGIDNCYDICKDRIDYNVVFKKLQILRNQSIEYLKENIKYIERL